MPRDLTPFPKPGASLRSDAIQTIDARVPPAKAPRDWKLVTRRVVWLVPLWLLGAYASRTIRSYYGHSVIPGVAHWLVIVGLAVGAGAVGGLLSVATRWSSLFLTALLGAGVWAGAFVSAIPETKAVCGGDVVNGCEHVQAIEWPVVGVGAYVPILVGLLLLTSLWRRIVSATFVLSADR
jgi:hypothetical protein